MDESDRPVPFRHDQRRDLARLDDLQRLGEQHVGRHRARSALGDCSFATCPIDAGFLLDAGFTVVAPHRYFPRLRLELDKGLGWKAEVEEALERLLRSAALEQPVGAGNSDRGAALFDRLLVGE